MNKGLIDNLSLAGGLCSLIMAPLNGAYQYSRLDQTLIASSVIGTVSFLHLHSLELGHHAKILGSVLDLVMASGLHWALH
jgi:hypothetical protein